MKAGAVEYAHFHVSPPFKAPLGGGLGKPPSNFLEKGVANSAYTSFLSILLDNHQPSNHPTIDV